MRDVCLFSLQCKCAQYWPDQGCWTYGNVRVSVEDVTVLVDYTVRKFCIQQVQSSAPFLGILVGSADHQDQGRSGLSLFLLGVSGIA